MARTSDARERLLSAALELIWGQSYYSVGVDAICAKAGVKKGSFYHFFSSKADLIAEAMKAHWEGYKPVMDSVFSPTVPPLQRLTDYFDKLMVFQRTRHECTGHVCGCPYFDLGAEAATMEPALVSKIAEVLDQYYRYFESAVREAHARGEIAVDDPAAAARWLFNLVEGTLTNARIHNNPELLKDLSSAAMHLLGAHKVKC